MLGSAAVFLLNFCALNPLHRKAAKRQVVKKLPLHFIPSKNSFLFFYAIQMQRFKHTQKSGYYIGLTIVDGHIAVKIRHYESKKPPDAVFWLPASHRRHPEIEPGHPEQ
jgi:hypothetical protein